MFDSRGGIVEVQVSEEGRKIWVNVDGKCVLRVYDAQQVSITDDRDLDEDE